MYLFERARMQQATELHIYDFDDTLFDSPVPPWKASGVKPPEWKGRDWWASPESLAPPYVPAGGEAKLKLPAASDATKSRSSGAYTVVVTGRRDEPGMREKLKSILDTIGIGVDAVFLKPDSKPTAQFKATTATALIGNMPLLAKVAMWDDMADNLKAVANVVADKGLAFDSNLVRSKHHVEHRMPDLVDLVLALDARLRGDVSGEGDEGAELGEGRKPYPVGTIRDWKDGKVIKTANGWEPYEASKALQKAAEPVSAPTPSSAPEPAPAPVPEPAAAPSEPAPAPAAPKTKKFDEAQCAKALRDFFADPSPAAQQAVREQFNTLCADFGMLNRDKPPGGGQFLLFKKDSNGNYEMGAEGLHAWDGTIKVKEKHAVRAAVLLEGKGPSITGLADELNENKHLHSMRVLVHETIHGHSPIRQENFKGRYRLLEEATTEMAARKVMADRFGANWAQLMEEGSYRDFCEALSIGAYVALKKKGISPTIRYPFDWTALVGEACVEMRRRPPPHDPDKYAYLNRFASCLPVKGADSPDVVKEVAEAVWLALKPAREAEKARVAWAKISLISKDYQFQSLPEKEQQKIIAPFEAELMRARKGAKDAEAKFKAYIEGTASAADSTDEALNSLLLALMEAAPMKPVLSDDEGMLPRNDLPLAIEYAKVLASQGALTPEALEDLAMLQDDVIGASEALVAALREDGLKVV